MYDELMKRPSLADEYVRRRAAEIILPKVLGWMGPTSPGEEQQTLLDLMKVASLYLDGYELAKKLERYGWCPDPRLIEILDNNWVSTAIDELTSQWVRCLAIKPQFSIGDSVVISRGKQGKIVKIDEKLAQYGVRYPDMAEKSWTVVNFEDCSAPFPLAIPPAVVNEGAV